jgi:hypothetical protein
MIHRHLAFGEIFIQISLPILKLGVFFLLPRVFFFFFSQYC